MASNPMQRKARNSFLLGMLISFIICGIVIGFLLYYVSKQKKEQTEIEDNKIGVYILNRDYAAGESIKKTDLTLYNVDYSVAPNSAIQLSNVNTLIKDTTLIKIASKRGTILTTDLIVESEDSVNKDTREEEYNMIILPTQLQENDYIDVRLSLPSGEDYIVISKKKVKSTDETTIWLDLSEVEILTLSNAIVEAYQIQGSKLYAIRYIEPGIQAAAEPTYIPSSNVINLIGANSNILQEAKTALADRYQRYYQAREIINTGVSAGAENAVENVSNGLQESVAIQKQKRQEYLIELKTKK